MHNRMVISLNVGMPRQVDFRGNKVSTGIYKEPVFGRVRIHTLNVEGDRQADLRVHGGIAKAVYAYPSEHYVYWREEMPHMLMPWGMFGENLTTHGLLENTVHIGDRFRIGTAELMVTQPRLPCFKLGIKFGSQKFIKTFLDSQRTGFYFAVMQEGEAEAGDEIELITRDKNSVTVSDIVQLYAGESRDPELLNRVMELEALPESWRHHFME